MSCTVRLVHQVRDRGRRHTGIVAHSRVRPFPPARRFPTRRRRLTMGTWTSKPNRCMSICSTSAASIVVPGSGPKEPEALHVIGGELRGEQCIGLTSHDGEE